MTAAPVLPPILYWSPSRAAHPDACQSAPGVLIDTASKHGLVLGSADDSWQVLDRLPDDAVRLVAEYPAAVVHCVATADQAYRDGYRTGYMHGGGGRRVGGADPRPDSDVVRANYAPHEAQIRELIREHGLARAVYAAAIYADDCTTANTVDVSDGSYQAVAEVLAVASWMDTEGLAAALGIDVDAVLATGDDTVEAVVGDRLAELPPVEVVAASAALTTARARLLTAADEVVAPYRGGLALAWPPKVRRLAQALTDVRRELERQRALTPFVVAKDGDADELLLVRDDERYGGRVTVEHTALTLAAALEIAVGHGAHPDLTPSAIQTLRAVLADVDEVERDQPTAADVEAVAAWCDGIAQKADRQGHQDLAVTAPVIAQELRRTVAGYPLVYAHRRVDEQARDVVEYLAAAGQLRGPEPTAAQPWTVTLAWTPDQNAGAVALLDGRTPLFAILGSLASGEAPEVVAADFGASVEAVRVLERLRGELAEMAGPPDGELAAAARELLHLAEHGDAPDLGPVLDRIRAAVPAGTLDDPHPRDDRYVRCQGVVAGHRCVGIVDRRQRHVVVVRQVERLSADGRGSVVLEEPRVLAVLHEQCAPVGSGGLVQAMTS